MEKVHVAVIEKEKVLNELADMLTNRGYLVFKNSDEYTQSVRSLLRSGTACYPQRTDVKFFDGEFLVRKVK